MKIYRIRQLPHASDKLFKPYCKGKDFNLREYCCVWWDEWDDGMDTTAQLDKIFEKFNIDLPKHFAGHSLSVSDVIEVFDPENPEVKRELYYCEPCGWGHIDESEE